jgi:thiamine biosynthesis lipoprotein
LNRVGHHRTPPLELVDLLAQSRTFSEMTDGAFDVTVQPLWRVYAEHFSRPNADPAGPPSDALAPARAAVDYAAVEIDPAGVRFERPSMAITLNGIAQGYVTDRVADLLADAGVTNVLLDIGESRALGQHPSGRPWRVGVRRPDRPDTVDSHVELTDRALATSAGAASPFEPTGQHHHLFDPKRGRSAALVEQVSVAAPRATTADALSTALAISTPSRSEAIAARFPDITVIRGSAPSPNT